MTPARRRLTVVPDEKRPDRATRFTSLKGLVGILLALLGLTLALSQTFTVHPWQVGFALGCLLMVAGLVVGIEEWGRR